MKRWIALALLSATCAVNAQTSPAKKELVNKLMTLQQPGIDLLARNIAERPAVQTLQALGPALQQQVPPEKREATGKAIEAEVKKFFDEAYALLRERAGKLAPTTIGPVLEEKFSEDELKQIIAWLESPVNKKFQQVGADLQKDLVQKLVAEAGPALDPKLQALQQKARSILQAAAASPAPAKAPAKAASK